MGQWNDIYDEILAYYFWEPQHLGKVKNPSSTINTYKSLIEHSKKLEVSLNHQLSFFFSLVPNSFLTEFFSKAFGTKIEDHFVFDSSNTNSLITELKDLTQPDFFFVGKQNIVAIEMKIDSKTNLDQYMKYLLFNLLYQSKMGTNKQFSLLFLGKDSEQKLWKEGFTNFYEAKNAFCIYELPEKSKKGGIGINKFRNQLVELSNKSKLGFITYADFLSLILRVKSTTQQYDIGGVYIKLLQGMENEFKARALQL